MSNHVLIIKIHYVILYSRKRFIMEKNYYQIVEIDKNASPEIIKKAYNIINNM